MSYFNRLQQQAEAYTGFAERGQEQIQNFDTDKLIAEGQATAYKQGHQLMEGIVGQEIYQGLREGAPVLYRTGRALAQRARGMPTRPTRRTPEQPVGQDDNLPQGREEPPAAPSYEEAISSQARTAAERIRRMGGGRDTEEGRNLRYNTETGRVEDESGNPAQFADERESQYRTPLEQEQFENPNAGQRPIGQVPDRPDYGDTDLTSRAANARANQQFRDTQQEIERQRANQPEPEGERPPIAEDIDEATRSRGPYGSQRPAPLQETERQALPDLDELKAAQAAREAPVTAPQSAAEQAAQDTRFRPTSNPVERETRSIESLADKYRNVEDKVPIGSKEKFTPREEPEPLDLEDIPSFKLNQPTPLGRTIQQPQATQPQQQLTRPTRAPPQPPEQEPYQTQPQRPTRPAPEPPESELDRATRRLNELEEQERQAEPTARVTQPNPDQARQLAGDDKDKPPSYDDEADEADEGLKKAATAGEDIEKTEATLAPEEEVADAIPGVGEILGGLIAIGGAVAGAVEAAKSDDSPPKQPQGAIAPQLAFSSAPVIDSDDYHSR
jgi:hypothetical protein